MKRLLAAGLVTILAVSADSATINVPGEQPSIQAGIGAASAGDTVLVAPGVYVENIDFAGKTIVVRSRGGARATIIEPANPRYYMVRVMTGEGPGTELTGFTIRNGGDATTVNITSGSVIKISGNIFCNNISGVINPLVVIRAESASEITRNLFYGNGGINCIWSAGACRIINNTIDSNLRGIYSTASTTVALNNIITNNGGYGVLGVYGLMDYNDVWQNGSANEPGPNGISEDPMYVAPSDHDYSLQLESPCIDAGDPSMEYLDPSGTRNDMGAFPWDLAFPFPVGLNLVNEDSGRVVSHTPTFHWAFLDTTGSPTAYEVQVGTDDEWSTSEMWEAGEVFSADTFAVYSGLPLLDGEAYHYRVRLNNGSTWGGWASATFSMNRQPGAPAPLRPAAGEVIPISQVCLTVTNAPDGDADDLTYRYLVYADAGLSEPVTIQVGIVETEDITSSQAVTGLAVGTEYWWVARAFDGYESSPWSPAESFITEADGSALNVPADYPLIQLAVEAALDADTILVAPGVYSENIDLPGKAITLTSWGGPEVTILRPEDEQEQVIYFYSADSVSATIDGFTIRGGNFYSAVDVRGATKLTIKNNIFRGYSYTGYRPVISCLGAGADIRRNLFYGNQGSVCVLAYTGTTHIVNNTFDGNNGGIGCTGGIAVAVNNIVTNCSGTGVRPVAAFARLDYNNVWGNNGNYYPNSPGLHDISEDPLYNDRAARDYSLAASSPCIDAGDPSPEYTDLDGTRNDMGTFPSLLLLPLALNLGLESEDSSHVASHSPTFRWTYYDTVAVQSGYEIEVGTDSNWPAAEMWATGAVASSDSTADYAGLPLIDGGTYFYRVRVYNGSAGGDWLDGSFRMNSEPTVPMPLDPVGAEVVNRNPVWLLAENATDAEGDAITYDFVLYDDPDFTYPFAAQYGVAEQPDRTRTERINGLYPNAVYGWKVRAYDGFEYSEWSIEAVFQTRDGGLVIHVPDDEPTIQEAIDANGDGDTVLVGPGTYAENIDFGGRGLILTSSDGPDVTVINAPVHNRAAVAMVSGEPRGAEVSGFTISGGGKAGILCDGATVRIWDNIITGNWSTADEYGGGIDLNNSFGSSIRGNIIHNNSAATYGGAISIEKNSFLDTVAYNVIYNNHGYGEIRCLDNVVGLQIYNNTISTGAITGITCHANGTAYIRNNIIFDAADIAVRVSAGSVVAEYNCTFDNDSGSYNFTPGKGNMYEDAQFVDRAGRDYELTRASPCIDAGHPDAAFTDPDGTRNDMGALPYWFDLPYPLDVGPVSEDSTHVVSHTPTLAWSFYDVAGLPTAYEIEVGTDTDWEAAEMWSSGEVTSPDTQAMYAGLPLVDGMVYYYRVRLNNGIRWGGWADSRFRMNTAPSMPGPSWPTGGSPTNVAGVLLVVDNSGDAQLDPLVYDFEVYADAALTILVESRYGIVEEVDQTTSGHIAGLALGEQYWWRCRAFDGYEYTDWTGSESFVTRGSGLIRVPEDRLTLQGAIDVTLDGDTVLAAPGEYSENIDFLGKAIVVTTSDGPAVTKLQPAVAEETTVSIVSGEGAGTEFSGFMVVGGSDGSVIKVANSARALITHNIFTGYTGDRVVVRGDVPDMTISYNLFYGNQGIGCVGIYSGSGRIINNTFDGNRRGFFTISGAGIAKNNIVTNSTQFGISTTSGFTELNYNNVWGNDPNYNGLAGGASDISQDPFYMDGPNGDYGLRAESPCIDAGDPGLEYLDPDVTRNDMGAFPFDQELRLPLPVALNLGSELVSHVLSQQPTVYWIFYDTSGSQAGWEAEFGTDRDWTVAEMWDTGPVYSSDTSVTYEGAVLEDGVTYMYRLRVNNGSIWGDWVEASFHTNSEPEPPEPTWPTGQLPVKTVGIRLRVANAADTEMDFLMYDFEVSADSLLTVVVFSEYGVTPQPDTTLSGYVTGLEADRQYWWRARAFDGFEYSQWSSVESFVARATGIIYVPENFARIKNAIGAAGAGDTVLVAPGIYTENLDFGGKTIVVTSAGGPTMTTLTYANSYLSVLRIASGEGPGTEFSGFSVDGSNSPAAVSIGGGAQALIANNIFSGHTDSANPVIECDGLRATVRGNLFYENVGSMGILGSAGTVDIVNNTFDGNAVAVSALGGYRTVTAKNNIVTRSSVYGFFTTSIYKELDYNDAWDNVQNYGGCGAGPNSISEAPLFVDAANGDYTLLEASPCIDAGDPSIEFLDADGTRADMGAYARLLDFPVAMVLNMGAEDSTHVMNHQPVIQWSYLDTLGPQVAYELEVGSDDEWSAAEMWATGQVMSTDDYRTYAGATLVDGTDYWCRLRVSNGVLWGSWRQHQFHMNALPTIPIPSRPLTGSAVNEMDVHLVVNNSGDSESDELSYAFRVYADQELTVLVSQQTRVAEQSEVTASDQVAGLETGPDYWWLSRASDGFEYSGWSFPQRFSLRGPAIVDVPGECPTIQGGIDAAGPFDTVRVGPGVYVENLEIGGKDVAVMSSDGPTQTVLRPEQDSAHTVCLGPILGSSAELSGFTITGMTQPAFQIYPVFVGANASPLISRNIFYGNMGGAEIMVSSGAPRIINNTIIPAGFGIMASANTGAIVRNNIIAYSGMFGVSGDFEELDYNDFWGNGIEDYWGGAVPGAHDISLDPLFADTAGHDYHLLPGSPVVDAGDPDPAYDDPDGSRNDMGALPEEVSLPIAAGVTIVEEELQRVVDHNPMFAWTYLDEGGGQVQFEIEVGDDPYWQTADRWSSGIIESADTSVVYAGEWLRDGDEYLARVRVSDGANWGSWRVMAFGMNAAPTTPTAKTPAASSVVHVNGVRLTVGNASDADDDERTYEFEIYADELLSGLVWSEIAVAEGVDSTTSSLVSGLAEDILLWWRGRVFDGYEFSAWTDSIPFQTRGPGVIRVPMDAATIQAAIDQAERADTVLVAPGEYHENIDFSGKSIKLIGEGGASQTALIPSNFFTPVVTIANGEGLETEFRGFDVSGASSLPDNNAVIEIDNGALPTIRENVFHENFLSLDQYGRVIYCGSAAAVITDNVFYDNIGSVCVYLSEVVSKPVVANNTFDGNYRGMEVLRNSIVVNNIITNSAHAGITYSALDMPQGDYNCLYNNHPDYVWGEAAEHDINVDPLYVSQEDHDYSLQMLSPCVDAGHPGFEYVDPDGTRDDMGAIPFMQDNQPFAGFLNLGEENLARVAADAPVFYWTFMDAVQPGQAAYEIEVGADDDWSAAEMWATGSVASTDTSAIYAGLALEEGSEYFGRVRVNNGTDWGGWNEIAFRMNIRPTAPLLLRPVDLDTVPYEYVRFIAEPSVDGDGDGVAYDFEVYADESLSMLVASVVGFVPWNEDEVTTDYIPDLAAEEQYWWRVRAGDGCEYSDWSEVRMFVTKTEKVIHVPSSYATIAEAVAAAEDGFTILVAPGVYQEHISIVGKQLVVKSSHGPEVTIIEPSANFLGRGVLDVEGSPPGTEFSGFMVRNGTVGIHSGAQPLICGNIFTGYEGESFVLRSWSANPVIRNNLFYSDRALSSLYAFGGAPTVLNNTFDSCAVAVFLEFTAAVFRNNIVTNCSGRGVLANSFSGELDYNNIWNNSTDYSGQAPGPHDISVDPLYTGPDIGEYQLGMGSPCIDAGDPDPSFLDPDGTRNDMGAFPSGTGGYPSVCRLNENPRYVDMFVASQFPQISWSYIDTAEVTQAAYEVEIGTDDDWTEAEMWATGEVSSADSSLPYTGPALENHRTYFLRIRVNDGSSWGGWTSTEFLTHAPAVLQVPDEYITIQSAMNAGWYGDTVLVGPGLYTEYLQYPFHPLVVRSEKGADSTLLTCPDQAYYLVMHNGSDSASVFEGFTVSGGDSVMSLIWVGGRQNVVRISDNRFIDNGARIAITAYTGEEFDIRREKIEVTRNLFVNTATEAVVYMWDVACHFVNNTVVGGHEGISRVGNGSVILNNIFTGLDGRAVSEVPFSCTVDYNDFWDNGYEDNLGENGISADPMFVDASGGDFSLRAGSPCIDAGHPDAEYNDPDGSRNDMGAIPYKHGTGVDDEVTKPYTFSLSQNYPNPFNPATAVKYSIAVRSQVELTVYNILGQTVMPLVDQEQSAGNYTIIWDGTNRKGERVSSGVYFYRLEAGDYCNSRKMILLK